MGPIVLWLDVVSRVVHVSTAIVLVGGAVFSAFVLLPSALGLTDEQRQTLHQGVVSRWKRFVHGGIVLFLASGFYNYFQAMPKHKGDGLYHGLIGTKILLALVVFFLASALVGRSEGLKRFRDNRPFWTKVMVGIALVIVAISGFAKVALPGKTALTPQTAASPAQ